MDGISNDLAKKVAQDLVVKSLDGVIDEIQQNIEGSESDSERALWVESRKEVQRISDIASVLTPDSEGEPFRSDEIVKRRKAVLELWNRGTMTQKEIAEYINESYYNVRQDLASFRKKGYYVRPSEWTRQRKAK